MLKADGARWYHLYRRLKTQTRLYTWGQGIKGSLGLGVAGGRRAIPIMRRGPPRPAQTFPRTTSQWPTLTHVPNDIKVIADLQCGGFSTSILSSDGKLYVVGIIDSKDMNNAGEAVETLTQLHYLTESTSAIAQFSAGRRHILALTDAGEIISWDRTNAKGVKIMWNEGRDFNGRPTRVQAGWGESSAYVPETGIIFWAPVENNQSDDMLDGVTIQAKVVPGTARTGPSDKPIEVIAHIVLEGFIVWLTTESKVYACELRTSTPDQLAPDFAPFEVPGYNSSGRTLQDLQGQFNKFAVLSKGEVLAGNNDYLNRCAAEARLHPPDEDSGPISLPSTWEGLDTIIASRPTDMPPLQHSNVIQVAFGDHHYHALHANGTVTSYGNDSKSCGALGLGNIPSGGRFRGLRNKGWEGDAALLPAAEKSGRQVWFEPEKKDWLNWMEEKLGKGVLETSRVTQFLEENGRKQYLFSEWVEQEGRHWNEGPLGHKQPQSDAPSTTTTQTSEDFHLDPYFTIAIAAAGWHSGALVLVDEQKAAETRSKWITKIEDDAPEEEQHLRKMPGHFESGPSEPGEIYVWKTKFFPKIRLPDGDIMPNPGEVEEWRDGVPAEPELLRRAGS